jgi:CheY-like chemotaxis protein
MTPSTNHPNADDAFQADEGKTLRWTTLGIDPAWTDQCLRPTCERFSPRLQCAVFFQRLGELEAARAEWDLLFIGEQSAELAGSGLEAAIQWIALAQPLGCVIAVPPSASLGRQLSLMRAGSLEVLSLASNDSQVEQALARAVEAIDARRRMVDQDKLRLLNQLSISVNHEINNPLTGLMGTAELLLLENKNADEKTRRDLRLIVEQCRRIQMVTNRLKTINHLRTIPYGAHDQMLDLLGEMPEPQAGLVPAEAADLEQGDQFLPVPRLLVVDDNPLIIDLIARLFEQTFHVDGATTVEAALEKIEREPYDLALIDLILPGMNGLELFRAIRKIKPDQKALLTTAYQGDPRVEQALVEGALGCVYKPFQIEDLEQILGDVLRGEDAHDA